MHVYYDLYANKKTCIANGTRSYDIFMQKIHKYMQKRLTQHINEQKLRDTAAATLLVKLNTLINTIPL